MTRPTLLAISAISPWPIQNGYALRVRALLQRLAPRWRTVLISPAATDPSGSEPPLDLADHILLPAELARTVLDRSLADAHERTTRFFREQIASQAPAACLVWAGLERATLDAAAGLPVVVDRIDCQALRAWRELWHDARGRDRLRSASDLVDAIHSERALARRAFATIVVADDDARALRRISGASSIHAIPNGVDVTDARYAEAPEPTVVFSGVLGFRPNVDAARFLVREIWPRIARARPDARLQLVGRRPSAEVRELATAAGVELHADVPDLREALGSAWVCIAPMRSGAGIKNKVLEAWAVGRPVVLSRLAANGLRLDDAARSLVASDPAELAQLTLDLLASPGDRRRLGAAGRQLVRARHGWDPEAEAVAELIDRALAAGAARSAARANRRPVARSSKR